MVAFKEEFPYLKADSGQLFEFNRAWLREAIRHAAKDAGYPSWWLTDHVTESIAFYLRLRNDESFVAFSQLSQTVRYVLKVIGYKEIVPHFAPHPPPVTISLFEIAESVGACYELGFFHALGQRLDSLLKTHANSVHLVALHPCVKYVCGTRIWSHGCEELREEIVAFVRERLAAGPVPTQLTCSLR
jgi:hypothetical protein